MKALLLRKSSLLPRLFLFLGCVIVILLHLLLPFAVGSAPAPAAEVAAVQAVNGLPGDWSCSGIPFTVGERLTSFGGANNAGLGQPLPDPDALAVVSMDIQARKLVLWLYDNGQDGLININFDAMAVEPGTQFATGRFDPQGDPTLVYHGGQLKIIGKQWQGGIYRIYTGCGFGGS